MGIFRRVNDIIAANLNDMVDRFEDPEKMLKQAIREMEECVTEATAAAARAIASEKLVAKELAAQQQQVQAWQVRAERAVRAGDDELGRQALRRKAEHSRLVQALGDQLAAAQEAGRMLRRQIDAMRAKHAEAKRKLATLTARSCAAHARQRLQTVAAGIGRYSTAFSQFDRMCERVERAEAEADALSELCGATDPSAGLEDADDDEQAIEAELSALKQQVSGSHG